MENGEVNLINIIKKNEQADGSFVLPEKIKALFPSEELFLRAMEAEVGKRIKEKTIQAMSGEILLKNVLGPFYLDIQNTKDKAFLIIEIEKIKKEKLKTIQENISINDTTKDSFRNLIGDAANLQKGEAGRAGETSGCYRDITGRIILEGDREIYEKKLSELDDDTEKSF